MRKKICKIIVYLFFLILYTSILLIIKEDNTRCFIFAFIGCFSLGVWTFNLVEWLFKDKEYLIGN